MKTPFARRALSLLLTLCLVLSLVPAAWAEKQSDSGAQVPFTRVESDSSIQRQAAPTAAGYDADDVVRVSIVLEEPSVIEKGFDTQNLAANRQAAAYRSLLQNRQQAVAQAISRRLPQRLDVVWTLTLAANVISANVPYGQLDAIRSLPGVKSVTMETRYEPAVYETGTADPNMATSPSMIGSSAAYAAGYNGAGTRIAVIDTGTDTDHQSFDAAAFDYAIAQDGGNYDLLDADEIGQVLTQLNAYKRTLKDGRTTDATPTAEDLYVNTKLPFGYNYVDSDLDITHDNDTQGEHGSHVAGIAAANRYIPQDGGFVSALENVKVQGVAPDAQLITMKVFGKDGGAYDSDYMAAIEDAILLGCDAVNLSLGSSSAGFTSSGVYDQFLSEAMDTGLVLTISAGNAGSWADNTWNGYLYSDSVNLDTVGAPGSYTASLTVASADNVGYTGQYFTAADRQIFYTETASTGAALNTLAGNDLPYVLIDGFGDYGDWDGIDLTGKAAVCSRGETNFSAKAQNAFDAGAAAVLVYNNQPGAISMDLSDYTGTAPCVSITQSDGAYLKEQAAENTTQESRTYYTGTLSVAQGVSTTVSGDPVSMSSFSSWGVPGSLELKPEITAPGGSIYSVNGAIPGGQSYENMSGTSMAAPQMAGMTALVMQYLDQAGLADKTGLSRRQLAQSLLMSTAQPLTDASTGSFYPVIQQGAGLANVGDAIAATAYVTVDGQSDGKVKAELGDDPDRTGVYSFRFTLNNLTDQAQGYNLSADLFTQKVFEDYTSENDQWMAENGMDYSMAMYLDKTTRALSADVAWTVNGKTVEPDQSLSLLDFDGDGDVDRADGQALLDYACGNRAEISALDHADLDGNGSVTTYDAYLFLKKLNSGAVDLAAGGSAEIQVTVRLTDAEKQQLDADFENGAYIQGYFNASPITTAEGVQGVSHSIPMLAFYGGWTDASMFENGSWLEHETQTAEHAPYMRMNDVNYVTGTSEGGGSVYYWGGNPVSWLCYKESYLPERAALNNQNGDALAQYVISPIRNAAAGKMEVVSADGKTVYKSRELGQYSASFYYLQAQRWYQSASTANVVWAGTDANDVPLPDGSQAIVRVTLAPEYYVDKATGQVDWDALGDGATLSTLVTIDNTDPEILSVTVDPEAKTLTVTAKDNRYVADILVYNAFDDNDTYGIKNPDPQTAGETVSATFDIGYISTTRLRVRVYDYAANVAVYELDVGDILGIDTTPTEFSAYSASGGGWQMFDQDFDYYEDETVVRATSLKNIQAAVDADGKVFVLDALGNLYVQDEDLLDVPTYVAGVPGRPTDLAYNQADGYLYGISQTMGLLRIDKLTGRAESVGTPGITTGTLACAPDGTFYALSCEDGGLYAFTADTLAQPRCVGYPSYEEYQYWYDEDEEQWKEGSVTVKPPVNATEQSLTWNPGDGMLYWSQYDNPEGSWSIKANFIRLDPKDASSAKLTNFLIEPLVALFARDLDRTGQPDWTAAAQTPTSMYLDHSTFSMKTGESYTLTAYSQPWTLTDRSVVWSSSDDSVASVDENGLVTAKAAGSAVITAASRLDGSVQASCQITVTGVNLTLSGIMQRQDGKSALFTWDTAAGKRTDGGSVDITVGSAAYVPQDGSLYAQAADKYFTMHRLDAATGENLYTSGMAKGGLPIWDMTACQYLGQEGDGMGVYGPYVSSPASLHDNMLLTSGFDLSYYLTFVTKAVGFVGIASGGYQQVSNLEEQEDGSTKEVTYDTEVFYLLDSQGYVWVVNMAATQDGYTCFLAGLLSTDLTGKLPYLGDGDFQRCSLVYDQDSGALILSYFNGGGADLYLLYAKEADSTNLTAIHLGSLGRDVYAAALYDVSVANVESAQTLSDMDGLAISVDGSEPLTQTAISRGSVMANTGSLNAAPAADVADDGLVYVPVTLTHSHNGLLDVSYDAGVLTLERIAAAADLTSLRREDGSVSVGFADLEGIETPATLVFSVKDDSAETTDVTFTTSQQEEQTGDPLSARTETIRLKNAAQPDVPEEPVNPPKTGDSAPVGLWWTMLAAVPAAALVLCRRKKHS